MKLREIAKHCSDLGGGGKFGSRNIREGANVPSGAAATLYYTKRNAGLGCLKNKWLLTFILTRKK